VQDIKAILNLLPLISKSSISKQLYKLIVNGNTKINSNVDITGNLTTNFYYCSNSIITNSLTSINSIKTSELEITSFLKSQYIENSTNIITNSFNSTSITNKNLITTNDLTVYNTITSININSTNANITTSLNTPLIITRNINTSNLTSYNTITTTNINAENITSTNNITVPNITIGNALTANTIRINILNVSDTITTNIINATTANLTNLTALNNITSLNIRCTNTFTANTINSSLITTTNLNSPTITSTTITTNTLNATTISSSGIINNTNTINGNNINASTYICYNNIGIGTLTPLGNLHLNANTTSRINSTLIFTNLNNISIKIGYDANDFILGTFNINNNIWNNQLSIHSSAPANSININSTGNIGIGIKNTNDKNYKFLINGTLNATNIYKNDDEVSTINYVNQQLASTLTSYITTENANTNYYKNIDVDTLITTNINNVQNTIANSFQYLNNVYSSENRLPTANFLANAFNDSVSSNYYNDCITGIKETFLEEKTLDNDSNVNINYEIYSSSGSLYKSELFTYSSTNPIFDKQWKTDSYTKAGIFDITNIYSTNSNNFYNLPLLFPESIFTGTTFNKNNYRGEYLIFKVNQDFILKRFRFYAQKNTNTDNVNSAPGTWLCYGSKNGIDWTYIEIASNPFNRLTIGRYIKGIYTTVAYYEKTFNSNKLEFSFIGFIFNSLVDYPISQSKTLKLTRIELFGRFKITPIYISSNYFNDSLINYATTTDVNSKLNSNIDFVYPIQFINNKLQLDSSYIIESLSSNPNTSTSNTGDNTVLQNSITALISSYTNVWKSQDTNPLNYYLSNVSGCVGIGLTVVNPSNINNLKLNINGTAKALKIICDNFSGNGSEITNINYDTLNNKPDLRNLYNWNNSKLNNITNCYSAIDGNIGIGNPYLSVLNYKLNVVGSIYSTANIIGTTFTENGTNLINKYLTISDASLTYLNIAGGTINGSIGISTSISSSYKLNVNGNINSTSIFENGNNINNIYLSIINATNIYLSKNSGGTINNHLFINGDVGIGTVTPFNNNKLSIIGNIYSSSNIIGNNFIENNVSLTNKYLTISNASLNYFSNIGGTITGSIGISTSISSSYKLNVNGSIYSSNNIICNDNFIENGSILSDKYLSISYASNNYLSNVNPNVIGDIYENNISLTNKYLSQNVNIINCNIGFGTAASSSYKINVNGSIYSSNNIICSDGFIEYGSKLSNIYLSISYASNNYLSNINPIVNSKIDINGNINCSGSITENGILLSNKYLSQDGGIINGNIGFGTSPSSSYILNVNGSIYSSNNIICNDNFIENGSLLSDKYLSISYAFENYLSNINPIIIGDINCSGNIYENGILLTNKYLQKDVNIINCNIGFGTAASSSYKITVNGSIYSSNNIICTGNFIENGFSLNNKYLSISSASTNYLSNINPIVNSKIDIIGNINCSGSITENGILLSNKYLSQNGGVINGNIGFGTSPSSSYILNVNGSIYSSNNIICNDNFIENGSLLSDKYLSISYASENYLSNINPIIIGDINCSGTIRENGILLSNKYLSQNGGIINCNIGFGTSPSSYRITVNGSIYSSNNIICTGNFIENGFSLNNKYLSISSASTNYLSNINPIVNSKIDINGNINCSGSITENGILLSNKYLSRNGGVINGNIGFGTFPSSSYKITVNGSIYSSNNIICSNLICDNIKENGSNLSDIYVKIANFPNSDNLNISNPNIQKKIGLKFNINTSGETITLNNILYYKYNINISKYVNNKLDDFDNNPYRIFNIKCFSTTAVFRTNQINKPPNILQYDIYMSHLLNLDPPSLNICAIGFPSNYYLNKITDGDIFILKTNNFNYLSILSKYPNTNISCIITDFLF
jgi:hypothetical protein